LEAQYNYLLAVRDKITETHQAIKLIRVYRSELDSLTTKPENLAEIKAQMQDDDGFIVETKTSFLNRRSIVSYSSISTETVHQTNIPKHTFRIIFQALSSIKFRSFAN
jgi:hypothetical protein